MHRMRKGDTSVASTLGFAGLLRLLANALDPQHSLAEVTNDTYFAAALNRSANQKASVDAALEETKKTNLALVLVFTVALAVTVGAANMLV